MHAASCLVEPELLRMQDLAPAPFGSLAHRGPQQPRPFMQHVESPPMTGLSTTPPQLESSSSLRRAAAQCTAELLADAGRSTSCLSLVPPVRAGILREHKLDEYDVRIDVPLPRSLAHDANGVQLINPSVHCRDGRLLLAARAMWAVTVQPPCTDVWRSHTILTSISFDKRARTMTLARAPNGTFTGGSRACIADLTAGRKGDIYDHDEAGDEGDDSDGGGGKVHSDGGNSSVLEGGGSDISSMHMTPPRVM